MTEYRICQTCVMDSSDPDIIFYESQCNHCRNYPLKVSSQLVPTGERQALLNDLLKRIKMAKTRSKKYDCVIGVSGGVDSSYVAYLAKLWGLNALLVHLDNGWNSEISVKNISNIAKNTGFDLFTYVIDWDEFRDLQLALFRASVVDIELATDHAIKAVLYKVSAKFRINFILSGGNVVTEAIMPVSWRHTKVDWANLKDIHQSYGERKIRSYPRAGILKQQFYKTMRKISIIQILNYVEFDRPQVMKQLSEVLGWEQYGGKHHESIFTRFYQAYILPKKFNIDKRRAHFSNLVCAGQISRKEALDQLELPPCHERLVVQDREFVIKKLGWKDADFDAYMAEPPRSHYDFKTDERLIARLTLARDLVRRLPGLGNV